MLLQAACQTSGLPSWQPGSSIAKVQFLLHGMEAQMVCFALVTTVLPNMSAGWVTHILTAPGNICYNDMWAPLLGAH